MYLSVSTTINLDNKILLVSDKLLRLCFRLTDVVYHRLLGLFAFVLDDKVYVLQTALILEAGKTFVVEELVIIRNVLLLTIFQYNLRIIERSLSHECCAISQIHDFTCLWSILQMLLRVKWAHDGSLIALLKEVECLLFLISEILVCITLLQSRVRSYVISVSNFACRKLMSGLHLILDQELNRQLFLVEILRH